MSDAILSKKQKIQQILNCWETGSIKGNYADVSIFADGPGDRRQITYGRSQTTEWGHLQKLMDAYVDAKGALADFFDDYIPLIGNKSLVNDKVFIAKLKEAGKEPLMHKVQDEFFDIHYWDPAFKFMVSNGFTSPLAGLVIYDSYIHSGGIPAFLRRRFDAMPPARGGIEKDWILQYLNVRLEWLTNHSRPILRKTTYRIKNMLSAVNAGDYQLDRPFIANGIKNMTTVDNAGIWVLELPFAGDGVLNP